MKKIILILALFCANLLALTFDEIKPTMQKSLDDSIQIISTDENLDLKADKIAHIFDDVINYKLMARLSLSNLYKELNKDQKEEFTKLFKENIKSSFSQKLALYSGQKIQITDLTKPKETRAFLDTVITGNDGKIYNVVFKFFKNKKDEFHIYDIDITGVSLIQTYRAQFEDLGSNAGFSAILERLKATNLNSKISDK